jgi:hypothetical protein
LSQPQAIILFEYSSERSGDSMFSLIGNQRNFIKNVGAPEHTGSIQNDIKTKRAKKQG